MRKTNDQGPETKDQRLAACVQRKLIIQSMIVRQATCVRQAIHVGQAQSLVSVPRALGMLEMLFRIDLICVVIIRIVIIHHSFWGGCRPPDPLLLSVG